MRLENLRLLTRRQGSAYWRRARRASAILIAFMLVLSSCVGNSPTTSVPDGTGTTDTLVVGIGAIDTAYTQMYFGLAKGYFRDAGLDLQVKLTPSTSQIAALMANQIDFAGAGVATSFLPVRAGEQVSIVYGFAGGGGAGVVFATNPAIKTIADCRKVAGFAYGSTAYAYAIVLQKVYGVSYEILQFGDPVSLLATVETGNADCGIINYSVATNLLVQGKAHLVVDPRDMASLPSTFPTGIVESVFFVRTSNAKRPALVKFLRAMNRSLIELRQQSSSQIATALRSLSDFQPFTQDSLAATIENSRSFWGRSDGFISEEVWNTELNFLIDGGQTFIDPSDPTWSYEKMVDMSYYDTAIEP